MVNNVLQETYKTQSKRLIRSIRKRWCYNGADAEDALHDAIVKLLEKGEECYSGRLYNTAVFLRRNQIDHAKVSARLNPSTVWHMSLFHESPEEEINDEQIDTLLIEVLSRLDPKCTLSFYLRYFNEEQWESISKQVGMSVRSVQNYVNKAIGFLKENLNNDIQQSY